MRRVVGTAAGILALLIAITGCTRDEPEIALLPQNSTVRAATAPEKDFFTGAELLELNGIAQEDVVAVTLHVWLEDGSEGTLQLTNRAALKSVYQTFADAEIAWDIIRNTNPSTGEQLDMDWYLKDGTILRFYMRYDLGIEGIDDPLLFSSGASQDDYIKLYHQYQTS